MEGPEKRRKREREQRRKVILRAARKLFADYGFRPVTVASIAKKAELSKGAIYLYFESKEEIYTQILLSDLEYLYNRILAQFKKNETASERLFGFADVYIESFIRHPGQFRTLMNFMVNAKNLNLSNATRKQLIRETNKSVSLIERILQYGADSGDFNISKQDIKTMRNALWGLLNGVIALNLFVGVESAREERIRTTVRQGMESIIAGLRYPEQSGSGQTDC